jgi:hypothetical protein
MMDEGRRGWTSSPDDFILHPSSFILSGSARWRALVAKHRIQTCLKPLENAHLRSAYRLLRFSNDNVSLQNLPRSHRDKSRLSAYSVFASARVD